MMLLTPGQQRDTMMKYGGVTHEYGLRQWVCPNPLSSIVFGFILCRLYGLLVSRNVPTDPDSCCSHVSVSSALTDLIKFLVPHHQKGQDYAPYSGQRQMGPGRSRMGTRRASALLEETKMVRS